jgi:DNA invertase Pin-like site-specific DNA recombinase
MEKSQIPVAILVRVSTAKQETARQISELRQYADSKGYEVLEVCEETISGSAEDQERDGLRRAERLARDGKIKKVLVHEISRIAPMKMPSQRVRESNPCTSLERAVS